MRLPRFQVVGLYGRGGIGKTTFCKAMCNEMWTDFNGKVFYFELEGENMLKTYQTLLAGLTGTRNEDVQILDSNEVIRCVCEPKAP
jgi:ABC-type multidrug transport system ATPase subunit